MSDVIVETPENCKEILMMSASRGKQYVNYIDTDGNHRFREFSIYGDLRSKSYIMKPPVEKEDG